jgi:transitional endoplasmic reticulum ATPase
MAESETATLRMVEAFQQDIGLGGARLDLATQQRLQVGVGDLVELQGPKTTAAIVRRAAADDEGKGLVRAEFVVRRNAGVPIGERVQVRKLLCPTAASLTIAPVKGAGAKGELGPGFGSFVSKALNLRPCVQGDVFVIPGVYLGGEALPFLVTATGPSGIVQIGSETVITIRDGPAAEADLA